MPNQPRSILRTRLFPIIFILALLPIAGMGGLFYRMSLQSVQSVLQRQTLAATRAAAASIAAEFPRLQAESTMPARSRKVRTFYQERAATRQAADQELRAYSAWFLDAAAGRYAQVIYLDGTGEPLFQYDPAQAAPVELGAAANAAFAASDWDGAPGPGERLRISVQQTPNHGLVFRFGRPVRGSPSPGYVLLDVPLEKMLPGRMSEDIALLLVNRSTGQVLYGPDGTTPDRPLAEILPDLAPLLETVGADSSGSIKFAYQEKEHLASYVHLSEPAWTLAALVATEPYTAGPRQAGLYTLAVAALFVLVAGTLLFLLVRRVQERSARLEEQNLQIQEANRRIQEADQLKSDFLARMSHDLRTPMNAITGYTRILLRKAKNALDARQYRNLENIQLSADHLLTLINDILDLSKIESGRMDLQPEEVNLEQLIAECTASVESLLKPQVELKRHLEAVHPIHTDPDRLRRVLMNLLSNAVKFTEEGSIGLFLESVDGWTELTVADTGVGIPPEDLPHIFDEFHQVSGRGRAQKEGTGLGLAIAKKSVELLGGTIDAESTVGEGTTFKIRIADYRG